METCSFCGKKNSPIIECNDMAICKNCTDLCNLVLSGAGTEGKQHLLYLNDEVIKIQYA